LLGGAFAEEFSLCTTCLTISVGGVRLVWVGKEKKRIDYNVLKAAVADGAPDGRGVHAVSGRVPFDRERRG
jgi:hypothetical protein